MVSAPGFDYCGRFAPSTTGPAHAGTLLSALLCWCHARSSGGRVLLRLEDLDPQRCRPAFADAIQDELAWLGLDWDAVEMQSANATRHAAALDALAQQGRLYACSCSRALLQAGGTRAPDGSWRYANTCRSRLLGPGRWRACDLPLRALLPDGCIAPREVAGMPGAGALAQDPVTVMGDPVVRRRDGAMAYQLAVVVDDAAAGVNTVVRGRDIACSTATQVGLQRILGLPEPSYWHHFLLVRPHGDKLAKLHGDAALPPGVARDPQALCGWLAWAAGLVDRPEPVHPHHLLQAFSVARVRRDDRVLSPAT